MELCSSLGTIQYVYGTTNHVFFTDFVFFVPSDMPLYIGSNPHKVLSDEVCTGANVFSEGTDPTLKPDDEYPEWLWELSKPMKTIKQIRQQVCSDIRTVVKCIALVCR